METPAKSSLIESKLDHEFLSLLLKENYDSNVELLDYELKKKGLPGDNYMSVIYDLNLTIRRTNQEGKTSIESTSFVLKALPTNPPVLKYIRELRCFETEKTMYQIVFPELIALDSSYDSFPRCISSSLDEKSTYILLENLAASGYKMPDRISGLNLDEAVLAISELAKFHGLSFIKYRGNGDSILENHPELIDNFWVSPEKVSGPNRHFIKDTLSKISRVLKDEGKAHVINRLEMHFHNIFERMHEQVSVPERFPAVINLGDCWTNNFMFQYDEQGKPTKIKFIDFQLARATSRCSDLAYLIFTSVQVSALNSNLEKLLRTYHESFCNFVKAHGNGKDPLSLLQFQGEKLSWENFSAEFEHYRSYGTTMALILTPLMLASSESVPDLDKLSESDMKEASGSKKHDYTNVWQCKAVRDKLIAIASGHLPMCFKPAQAP